MLSWNRPHNRSDPFPLHAIFTPAPLALAIALAAAAVVLFGPARAAKAGLAPSNYTLTDLGTLPGFDTSYATAINSSGQVVGASGPFQATHAFLYTNGAMQDLGVPGANAVAMGINSSGQIVGNSTAGGFLYSNGSLQILSGVNSATAINDLGQIAGTYTPKTGPQYLNDIYILTNGTLHGLGITFPYENSASAINNKGQVVGDQSIGPPNYGFVYDSASGTFQYPPSLGGYRGSADGINNAGQVVGASDLPYNPATLGNVAQAYLFDGSVIQDLGSLDGPYGRSGALGINDAGEIVGTSDVPGGTQQHGFLYVAGTMYDLNGLVIDANGDVITNAVAINAGGQIAADVTTPSGVEHAVLLTPTAVALPSAAWAALAAMPFLLMSKRLRRSFH